MSPIKYRTLFCFALVPASAVACASNSASEAQGGSGTIPDGEGGGAPSTIQDASANSASPEDAGSDARSEAKPAHYTRQLVNFDDVASGVTITDQYKKWFVVSVSSGCGLETLSNYDFGQSAPNYVTTYFSCAQGETSDVTFTFARPVRKITLNGIGINGDKAVATMKLTHADGSASEVPMNGIGSPLVPTPIEVADKGPISKLLFTDIKDAYGIGFDDLAFDFPDDD